MTELPLPAIDDQEGDQVPDHLPAVVDAHVHIFPDLLYDAVWGWFDQFGWPIRYRLYTDELVNFLLQRGIRHIVALQYAHKPGMADELNRYMGRLVHHYSAVTGLATVFPGESGAREILETAIRHGLRGVKLHSHVQCFEMDSPGMHAVYRVGTDHQRPHVIHAGRESKSPAYARDPYKICHWTHVEKAMKAYPDMKRVVPHLGADEFEAYHRLSDRNENLWFDTTMMLADYLPIANPPDISQMRFDRLMFGTDFPNIPYAWDRELTRLTTSGLDEMAMDQMLAKTAADLFAIDITGTLL